MSITRQHSRDVTHGAHACRHPSSKGPGAWSAAPAAPMAHAAHVASVLQGLQKGKLVAERLRGVLAGSPSHVVAAAFGILDTRGAAQRALDVFRILRSLPPSDPLSALCNSNTYASIIALVRIISPPPPVFRATHLHDRLLRF